jgi:hypothetical protein
MNALDTRVCRGAGRSRAFIFTNYSVRRSWVAEKLFSVRGQCKYVCVKTTYLEARCLSIYRFTVCLRKINRDQKETVRRGALDMRNWAIFHEPPKNTNFFGSTIRRARHPAAALQKWGASTQAKRARAETPTFEGNIGKRPSQHHLHAEFACDQFESVEPTKHFPSPHPPYTNGDHASASIDALDCQVTLSLRRPDADNPRGANIGTALLILRPTIRSFSFQNPA